MRPAAQHGVEQADQPEEQHPEDEAPHQHAGGERGNPSQRVLTIPRHGVTIPLMNAEPLTDWRQELRSQGRKVQWLADATGTPRATVYAYSCGVRRAPEEWLRKAYRALGVNPEKAA